VISVAPSTTCVSTFVVTGIFSGDPAIALDDP
jgi:hypothetical protein